MKKLLILPLLAVPILLLHAAIPSPQNITFNWTYPTNIQDTNLVFRIYKSANPAAAIPWPLFAVVPGTQRTHTVAAIPAEAYYYIAASNFWGEADPSNVAGTPPVPSSSGVLSVTKGP